MIPSINALRHAVSVLMQSHFHCMSVVWAEEDKKKRIELVLKAHDLLTVAKSLDEQIKARTAKPKRKKRHGK